MRLPRVRKQKPKKEDTKKVVNIKHEIEKHEMYFDESPFKFKEGVVKLSELRYGIIESCNATGVKTGEDEIEIENSWEGIILVLINAVYNKYGEEKFLDELIKQHVIQTGTGLVIDKEGIERIGYDIALSKKKGKYKSYTLFDKGYCVKADFNTKTVYEAIIKLAMTLGYDGETIMFRVVKKGRYTENV